jgi:RND family efflux transporter MFP subunit
LRRALWDDSNDVQAAARNQLFRLGETAVPPLVKSLGDATVLTRIQALQALASLGSMAKSAAPAVISLLSDRDADVRCQALITLSLITSQDPAAIAAVTRVISDAEMTVRNQAIQTLCAIDTKGEVAVPLLVKSLKDPDSEVRYRATVLLGKFGTISPLVIPALQEATKDLHPGVREEANEVLRWIDPQFNPGKRATAGSQAEVGISQAGQPPTFQFADNALPSPGAQPTNGAPLRYQASQQEPGTEVAVHVGKVRSETLRHYVTAYGTVEPEPSVEGRTAASARILAPVEGLVAEVNCHEGQHIEKGQVLFTLDGRKAEAAIEKAKAILTAAQQNYDQLETSVKQESPLRWLVELARQDRDRAKGELDSALAQQQLLKITAPLSGTVVFLDVRPGESVNPFNLAPLVEVVDMTRLIVAAKVPASQMPAVKAGQTVEIQLPKHDIRDSFDPPETASDDAGTTLLAGKVTLVEDFVDLKTDMGTVDISVEGDFQLRSGQFVRVRIVTEARPDCLTVPARSVVKNEEGEWVISVVRGNWATQHAVQLGFREGGKVQILGRALKVGDVVVTIGALGLPKESKIRIIPE